MPSLIGTAFRAGTLDAALASANDAVRKSPGDINARVLLAELLIFAGNLERADRLLDAASAIDPSADVVIAEFRQLLRAEIARRQFWQQGRVPEILGTPTASEQALLAAII